MKKPLHAPLVIAALALYGFGSVAHAGDPLKGLTDLLANGAAKALEGTRKKPADAPTRDGQEARNGTRTSDEGGGGRPYLSELRDEDFRQNDSSPAPDPNNTRIRVAGNLMLDITGQYPNGYQPAWRFISKPSPLSVKIENWAHPQSKVRHSDFNLFIGDYGGKAVIRFKAQGGFDKECFADIVIKNAPVVLASNPQVFELGNFRRILNDRSTGEDCAFSSSPGGWGGRIALSANGNGDILMDLMMESYTVQRQVGKKVYPAQVHLRHIATGITVENEMSAAKAIAVVAAEQEAKQRLKEYLAKTTLQADVLQKAIASKFPQASEVRQCFESSRGAYIKPTQIDSYYVRTGEYAGSHTSYDLNVTTVIKNKCAHPITFVGIQQLRNDTEGYYLVEVSKTMPANYNYVSDQGALGAIFTSMVGMGSEFSLAVQDRYVPKYASVGSVQWLKVVRN